MTYTTSIKEEIAHTSFSPIESICELAAFIRYDAKISKKKIELTIENGAVARRIYKLLKISFNINAKIIYRTQRKFRTRNIYILEITQNVDSILEKLNIIKEGKKTLPEEYFLASKEEKVAFLKGLFLSSGSINDPKNSGYHLEFVVNIKRDAEYITKLLSEFSIIAKILKRGNHYMIYIKSAEMISDLLKLFGAINSLFYFEDIRIYRDHKNMVNRLNNCEIANQEKIIKTGLKQISEIQYLKDNNLLDLLDERTKEIIEYRQKYPEVSYQELAEIITSETSKPIGKSGINHYFIKIKKLIQNHQLKNNK